MEPKPDQQAVEKFIITTVVDNRKGVMARIATLLARKGYNISSICVGRHMNEGEASIVLAIHGTEDEILQAKNMLGKLINVISIEAKHRSEVIERELCLMKIKDGRGKEAVEASFNGFNAHIVQEGKGFCVIEICDYPEKVTEFVSKALKEFEVIDFSRSGTDAI